jgi:hypothetical protein
VIGHIATALHFEKLDPKRGQGGFRYAEVSLLPGSPEGNNRRVFDEEQDIPQAILSPKSRQPPLQGECFGVGYEPKVNQATGRHQ